MVSDLDNVSRALTKPNVHNSKRIWLRSPMLHIGSAVSQLNPFEYVQTANTIYLPDSERLARALDEKKLLDDYIKAIENRTSITSVLTDAFNEDWPSATDNSDYAIFPKHLRSKKWVDGRVTDLRPMIRDGFGQLYIPGSSIKGAIRTAIAYHLLKYANNYKVPKSRQISSIEQQLQKSMGQLKQRPKFTDDELFMNDFFQNYSLKYQQQSIQSRNGPNTDFMRAVQVADSGPLLPRKVKTKSGRSLQLNQAVTAEVIVSSRFDNPRAKYRASLYVEMVHMVDTFFTLSIDTDMLSWFTHNQGMQIPFETVDQLLDICQDFAQDQWDHEYNYWHAIQDNPNAAGYNLNFSEIRHHYEAEDCPYKLRLGWASGFGGTTIGLQLSNSLRSDIRDAVGLRAPGFEAPKSRRTVVDSQGDIRFVPGWVKLEVR